MIREIGRSLSGGKVRQCTRCNTVFNSEMWSSCPHCSLVEQNDKAGSHPETRWVHINENKQS